MYRLAEIFDWLIMTVFTTWPCDNTTLYDINIDSPRQTETHRFPHARHTNIEKLYYAVSKLLQLSINRFPHARHTNIDFPTSGTQISISPRLAQKYRETILRRKHIIEVKH